MAIFRILFLFLVVGNLAGCSGWWGGKEEARLPGERISIMPELANIRPDPKISDIAVRLPRPFVNQDWPQAGGYAHHAMHHLSAKSGLVEIWDEDIGDGSSNDRQLLGAPVISGGRIYTMDADAEILALDARTGNTVWEREVEPTRDEETEGTLGGGLAVSGRYLFATTGFGVVVGIDTANGKILWRRNVGAPIRSAPTVFGSRVFVVTIANQTHALDFKDGRSLWTHSGISETATLFGGASPAAGGSTVVVSYSSGEIVALRLENGRQIWSDSLTALRRTDPVSALAHIRGRPVIDRGRVIASANSGRTVAIDLRTGTRIWERNIGSSQSPWVVGEYIYLVTNGGQLVCLMRESGDVRWIVQLPRFEDEEDREDPIYWTAPVLAGDRLLLGGSHGEVWSVSPYSGKFLGRIELSDPLFIAPVIANDTVYFLADDATLSAYR